MAGGLSGLIDTGDGLFVNIGGNSGELVNDPQTGELKFVVGSNQPIGGGAGGSTQASATGAPAPAIGTQTLVQLLQNAPAWAFPVGVFVLILFFGVALFRGK